MKALLCSQHGLPDTLQLADVPTPAAGATDVLIRVHACGVNFPDVLIIQNKYQIKPELPFAPGGEVSGIAEAVGAQVRHIKPGDRVIALCGFGGFAEHVVVPAKRVFPAPPGMDFLTGATTLYTYGTSYHALKDRGQLRAGETILVLGAGGGVGLAAVELAKIMGATVVAAASSSEKLALCKEKGADALIDYSKEDLRVRLKEITSDRGVDVVYDPIGGPMAESALRSMAWKGRYLVVGFASGPIPQFPANLPLLKGCSIVGVFWGSFAEREPQLSLQNFGQLLSWIQQGKIKQHLHRVYPLSDAASALNDLMNRKVVGKAVVKVGDWTEIPAPAPEKITLPIPVAGKPMVLHKKNMRSYEGLSLGSTEWITITQEMIQAFADATGDHQWIHVDVEKARTHLPGGKTIAHGYFTLSLAARFFYDLVTIEGAASAINYGVNKVRFPAAVPAGSRLRMHGKVSRVEEVPPTGYRMYLEGTIELEGSEKPACVAEMITALY